jgi:hypothetical protein
VKKKSGTALNVSTFRHVAQHSEHNIPHGEKGPAGEDPRQLADRIADERLLSEAASLPAALGRPAAPSPSSQRRWIVGTGATLTGVTLIGGLALIVAGIVEMISSGFGGLGLAAVILGVVLVATHWGWVHVAEATATALEGHRERVVLEGRERWLLAIEPYARYEVSTDVNDDGAITIVRRCHRPVPSGEGRFTFVGEVEHAETHPAEEPAAAVAERAEALRRLAALDTDRERQRYEAVVSERHTERLRREQERRRTEVSRAESEALSERINANLRDPPLEE